MSVQTLSKYLRRIPVLVLGTIVFCTIFSSAAFAQWPNRKTTVTFNAPVEIPDNKAQVLPAGTYVFKLVDSVSDRNIVQILNKDESHVYATILAIPNYRLQATDKTVMTFAERAAGEPQAIRAWFYPGERWGQEFVYPKSKATQLAKITNLPVAYFPDEVEVTPVATTVAPVGTTLEPAVVRLRDVPVMALKPTGEVVQVAEVFQAPPAEAIRNASLPRTAGNLPLLALLGIACIGLSLALPRICVHKL